MDTAAGPDTLTDLRIRPSIRDLETHDPDALARFVEAMKKIEPFSVGDDRGYQYWAGVHGDPPPGVCMHSSAMFFPWHRAYLLRLEQALMDKDPTVSLPWWDFTSTASQTEGIPKSYRRPDDGGEAILYSSRIEVDGNRHSTRGPPNPFPLPTKRAVDDALREPNYISFWPSYYYPIHNALHGWIGGDARAETYTAYDPLFWAFHCAIDRDWWRWQLKHPGSDPPNLDFSLPGVGMIVRKTLDINKLGYEYGTVALTFEPR